jgi:uncharacterized protein (DUF1015 family)
MTKIKTFKAIRPTRDKVHLVATRPIYTYKKNILKAKLEENPYTFLRIIHPEFKEKLKTKANSVERFIQVKKQFEKFCNEGILIQDQGENYYVYQQTHKDKTFLGLIAGASVEDYQNDHIKKHEATLTSREQMFTEYLDVVGFNAEPVLLAHQKNENLNKVYLEVLKYRPEYEFSTTDEIKHELWLVNGDLASQITNIFLKIEDTYIADGHHRSASSAQLAEILKKRNVKTLNHNYFLAFFMDESKLNILEFNRLIKNVSVENEKYFLEKLANSFEIEKIDCPKKPSKEHQIVMNLKNVWYNLTCKPKIINKNHPVSCLDAEILTQYILAPLLQITDLKTDANIEFISGNLGLDAIIEPIKNGKADLGFVLYPISFEQVKKVADNQLIMPPKSTWVEPKLRSGLTIYNINE